MKKFWTTFLSLLFVFVLTGSGVGVLFSQDSITQVSTTIADGGSEDEEQTVESVGSVSSSSTSLPTNYWVYKYGSSYGYCANNGSYSTSVSFSGSGTSDDPYQIATAYDLAEMCYAVNFVNDTYGSACYVLTADIDLSSRLWVPIGGSMQLSECFQGTFDGAGHTISGMTIYANSSNQTYYAYSSDTTTRLCLGLFGYCYAGRITIKNLIMADPYIYIDSTLNTDSRTIFVGTIIAYVRPYSSQYTCNLTNVGVISTSSASRDYIIEVATKATSKNLYVGGLVGFASNSTISGCFVQGDIMCMKSGLSSSEFSDSVYYDDLTFVGGIVGTTYVGSSVDVDYLYLSNCYYSGDITCSAKYIGGLMGYMYHQSSGSGKTRISNCYAKGSIYAYYSYIVGGLVGYIASSYNEMYSSFSYMKFYIYYYDNPSYTDEYDKTYYSPYLGGLAGYVDISIDSYWWGYTRYTVYGYVKNCAWYYNSADSASVEDGAGSFHGMTYSYGLSIYEEPGSWVGNASYSSGYAVSSYDVDISLFGIDSGNIENSDATLYMSDYEWSIKKNDAEAKDETSLASYTWARNVQYSTFSNSTVYINDLFPVLTWSLRKIVYSNYNNKSSSADYWYIEGDLTVENPYVDADLFAGWVTNTEIFQAGDTDVFNATEFSYVTLLGCWDGKAADYWSSHTLSISLDGSRGTESRPYLIYTAGQLAQLAYMVNSGLYTSYTSKYFKLMADIDLSDYYWVPIGGAHNYISRSSSSGYSFSGTFDGNGHVISGLKINVLTQIDSYYTSADSMYIGLFGRVTGTVKNLIVTNATITTKSFQAFYTNTYFGVFAGYASGATINQVGVVSGSTTNYISTVEDTNVATFYLSGFVAYAQNCYAKSSFSAQNVTSTVSQLYSTSDVYNIVTSFGGLFGRLDASLGYYTNDCFYYGTVTIMKFYYVGGLIGCFSSQTTANYHINRCYVAGSFTVRYSYFCGGLFGLISGRADINCLFANQTFNKGSVICMGGIAGYSSYYSSNDTNHKQTYRWVRWYSGISTDDFKYNDGVSSSSGCESYTNNTAPNSNDFYSGSYYWYVVDNPSSTTDLTDDDASNAKWAINVNGGKYICGGLPVLAWCLRYVNLEGYISGISQKLEITLSAGSSGNNMVTNGCTVTVSGNENCMSGVGLFAVLGMDVSLCAETPVTRDIFDCWRWDSPDEDVGEDFSTGCAVTVDTSSTSYAITVMLKGTSWSDKDSSSTTISYIQDVYAVFTSTIVYEFYYYVDDDMKQETDGIATVSFYNTDKDTGECVLEDTITQGYITSVDNGIIIDFDGSKLVVEVAEGYALERVDYQLYGSSSQSLLFSNSTSTRGKEENSKVDDETDNVSGGTASTLNEVWLGDIMAEFYKSDNLFPAAFKLLFYFVKVNYQVNYECVDDDENTTTASALIAYLDGTTYTDDDGTSNTPTSRVIYDDLVDVDCLGLSHSYGTYYTANVYLDGVTSSFKYLLFEDMPTTYTSQKYEGSGFDSIYAYLLGSGYSVLTMNDFIAEICESELDHFTVKMEKHTYVYSVSVENFSGDAASGFSTFTKGTTYGQTTVVDGAVFDFADENGLSLKISETDSNVFSDSPAYGCYLYARSVYGYSTQSQVYTRTPFIGEDWEDAVLDYYNLCLTPNDVLNFSLSNNESKTDSDGDSYVVNSSREFCLYNYYSIAIYYLSVSADTSVAVSGGGFSGTATASTDATGYAYCANYMTLTSSKAGIFYRDYGEDGTNRLTNNVKKYVYYYAPVVATAFVSGTNYNYYTTNLSISLTFESLGWGTDTGTEPTLSGGVYQVSCAENLVWLSYQVAQGQTFQGKTFKQTAHIDMSGIEFYPIGNEAYGSVFKGTYNGNGYTISNLSISVKNVTGIGLFGYVSGATIKNVTLQNGSVAGTAGVGAIVGCAENSTLKNLNNISCALEGWTCATLYDIYGTILTERNIDSYSATGYLDGRDNVGWIGNGGGLGSSFGGIVGDATACKISACASQLSDTQLIVTITTAGAVAGKVSGGSVSESYSLATSLELVGAVEDDCDVFDYFDCTGYYDENGVSRTGSYLVQNESDVWAKINGEYVLRVFYW